jgi:hypothetical protein
MESLRKKMESKLIDILLHQSAPYESWLGSHKGDAVKDAHSGVVSSLSRINDDMLLSLYTRVLTRGDIVPCLADLDGQFMNVIVGNCYGRMIQDGSIHT